MEEVLKELREIKELLRIIASNTEQESSDNITLDKVLENEFNRLNQELQKEFHKDKDSIPWPVAESERAANNKEERWKRDY